jgi:hypothetical protein
MALYSKQHIVPVFLLKKWAGIDARLCRFRMLRTGFDVRRMYPQDVAYIKNLVNFLHRSDIPTHYMESKMFGPIIDGPASNVINTLLSGRMLAISAEERLTWARFVASLLFRNPDLIRVQFRNRGDQLREMLRESQSDYDRFRSDKHPPTIDGFLDAAIPGYVDDIGISLMGAVIDRFAVRISSEMQEWAVVQTNRARFEILTGDRPIVLTEPMSQQDCMIVMPISPRHIFLASRLPGPLERLKERGPDQLVLEMNEEILALADKEVYSSNDFQRRFVQNRLR